MNKEQFKGPTWRYDPKTGEGRVFTDVADVPEGWVDSLDGAAVAGSAGAESASSPPPLHPPASRAKARATAPQRPRTRA